MIEEQVKVLDEIVRNHGNKQSIQSRLTIIETDVEHLKSIITEFSQRDIQAIRGALERINERNKTWGTLTLEIIAGFLAGVLTIIITGIINGQQPRNNVHPTGVQPTVFPILSRMRSS